MSAALILTCQAPSLLAAVKAVQPAVAGRTTKPVLACVRIDTGPGGASVQATDLELSMRAAVVTAVGDQWDDAAAAVCVSADRLAAILGAAGGYVVNILVSPADKGVIVKAGRAKYELPTFPADEFPDLSAEATTGGGATIDAAELSAMIDRVIAAVPSGEAGARWVTTGVLFELDGGRLRLVATDTKRLVVTDGTTAAGQVKASCVVPRKTVQAIRRALPATGEVSVAIRANEIEFAADRLRVLSRVLEGKFPPYDKIMPAKKLPQKATVTAGVMLAAVRQAAIVTDAESRRADFGFGPDGMTITASGAGSGQADITADLAGYVGDPVEIAFDPGYVLDALRGVGADAEVTLEMDGPSKPALFRLADGWRHLIMPLAE